MQQSSFYKNKARLFHGGELVRGQRKIARPLDSKRPIHFVLKARVNLFKNKNIIEGELKRLSEKFGLRLYDWAVARDHVHFVSLIPEREKYNSFIRSLTGLLARKFGKKLWALLPFSRIAHWGKDFAKLKEYLKQNRKEASGEKPYTPRNDWYKHHRPK